MGSVTGNHLMDPDSTLPSLRLMGDGTAPDAKNVYVANNYLDPDRGDGLVERDASDYNVIVNNNTKRGFSYVGSNTVVRNNIGFVQRNSGTATILNGNTSVTVAHGLSVTPDNQDFQVTPLENIGGKSVWVSGANSENFVINVSSPVTDNRDFAWRVEAD